MKRTIVFLIFISAVLISCSQERALNHGIEDYKASSNPRETASEENSEDKSAEGAQMKYVTIETEKGKIKAELYTKQASITTTNFIQLAESKFYDGLTFHRVEPGFVVQGGDPKGDGTGGSGKNIKLEINPALKHVKGALGMARSANPDSASSQFYIALEPAHFLDGNYAVFGKVTEGMDVTQKLEVGDKMLKVHITDK